MRKKILLLLAGIALAISSQAQFILIEHLHCHGDSSAVLSIIPNWGQAPYSFLWNTGDTTQTIHGLPTGNYICTVTDNNSFDSTLTYFVTEPSAINLVVDLITPSHCDGFNNGAVAISVSGGLPPYNYLWREIHFDSTYFTEDISGIRGGIYSLLIRDSNNCAFFEDSIIVPNDLFIPIDTSIESYVCNGLEGSVSLKANSAAPGIYFRYDWFNEGWQTFTSNDSVFGMSDGFLAGSYTITTTSLTTNIGCKAYTDFTIRQSETPMVVEAEIVHNNCPFDSIGSIRLQITGGDPHYHCEWLEGFGGPNIDNFYRDNLPSGNYTVRVFDDGVCESFKTISILTPTPMTVSLLAINDVACRGDSTGSIVIDQVLGGTPPLRLTWSNGQNGYHPINLKAGDYVLTVRDQNDCQIREVYTVTEPDDNIKFKAEVTSASCLERSDGKIIVPSDNIFASPGTNHFYLYRNGLLVGSFEADEFFDHLAPGDYSITMENELGCRQNDSVSVGVINRDCIIIPDFISPNNDGCNDSWKLVGACDYDQMEVVIYNSFQEQVFTSQDCNFVFAPKSGSGQYYAYYLKLKEAGKEYVIRGFFEVKY